jgi:hypothetical protein
MANELTVDSAFEYFLTQYGGDLRQIYQSYVRVGIEQSAEQVVIGFLNRANGQIVLYLMLKDENLVSKLVEFLKK